MRQGDDVAPLLPRRPAEPASYPAGSLIGASRPLRLASGRLTGHPPGLAEVFEPLGLTLRTFRDPAGSNKVGIIPEIPELHALDG